MLVRGLNVFPSQIERALPGVAGLEPHYQIVPSTRPDNRTGMRVRVETSEPAADAVLEDRVKETLGNTLELTVAVEPAPPRTTRSEDKAVRVLDQQEETT